MQTRVAVLVGWIVEEEVHGAFSLPSEGGRSCCPLPVAR